LLLGPALVAQPLPGAIVAARLRSGCVIMRTGGENEVHDHAVRAAHRLGVGASALADHDAFTAWLRERGIPYYGEAVAPPERARTLRRRDGEFVAEDGPYVSTESHLGGFYVIDVPSMAEAEEIARRCPTGTGTEIRPIWASAD
jgi:hypothetical protein